MSRRLVLVTGASAGIGAEFARQYAARGWDVALSARRTDRLEALAQELREARGVQALVFAQDLAAPDSVDNLFASVQAAGRHVDGLVNNAGYGLKGAFFETDWTDQADFIRVLFTAPVELVHKLLPGMKARGYGRIVNVASVAGYAPGAMGLYAAVKAAMIKFSESVQAECEAEGLNINCSALCPGLTRTEFHDVAGLDAMVEESPDWAWMEAAPVVEAGIEAVERGQPVCVPGAVNKGLATAARLLPEPLGRAVMKRRAERERNRG